MNEKRKTIERKTRFILASASPQRKALLAGLGVAFEVIPSNVDEDAHEIREPVERAKSLAVRKAQDVAVRHPERWVIGCDTLVVASDGTLLEKPGDAREARRMLDLQSGAVSLVHSGLALVSPEGKLWSDVSSSSVTFKTMSDDEKDWWIAGGFWKDRSGGFQIDGVGQLLIKHIEGDWTSIVGFPVFLFGKMLKDVNIVGYKSLFSA